MSTAFRKPGFGVCFQCVTGAVHHRSSNLLSLFHPFSPNLLIQGSLFPPPPHSLFSIPPPGPFVAPLVCFYNPLPPARPVEPPRHGSHCGAAAAKEGGGCVSKMRRNESVKLSPPQNSHHLQRPRRTPAHGTGRFDPPRRAKRTRALAHGWDASRRLQCSHNEQLGHLETSPTVKENREPSPRTPTNRAHSHSPLAQSNSHSPNQLHTTPTTLPRALLRGRHP
jgi:hypothetical protein